MPTTTTIEAEPEVKTTPGEQRFLLNGVSWETYRVLVEDPGMHAVRITYDNGAMELMSPSESHEYFAYLLGRLLEAMSEELGVKIRGCRSSTLRRELLKGGLEPDESYYIQNEPVVRGRRGLDFDVDPPPDLAIEVEITSSILNKIDVYQSLKIPEIWRFDGTKMTVLILNDVGEYVEREFSAAFPQLPMKSLVEWVNRSGTVDDDSEPLDENSLIREFRQWVRETLADDQDK